MTQQRTRPFTASEIAEFEYCPLNWWHEQFEPWTHADNDELFARLVEMEHEHGTQAPALPEYRMIEQLLLRRGAFDEGRRQHREHAQEVEESEEAVEFAIQHGAHSTTRTRVFTLAAVVCCSLALLLLLLALLWH